MRKSLINSEEEFFKFYIHKHTDENGNLEDDKDWLLEEYKNVKKPTEYPCISIYHHYLYFFIYKNDFEQLKN